MGLDALPAEDSGSQTAGWYRYQYAVTAARCLELLISNFAVVVEWHTDIVMVSDNPTLVSVKHREPGRSGWTIAAICSDGDLGTLRKRWLEAQKQASCEFLTNAGLHAGKNEARRLAGLLASGDIDLIPTEVVQDMSTRLKCTDDETREFLGSLSITTTGGDRETIDGILIERAVRPVLDVLGINQAHARKAYRAIETAVRDVAAGCAEDAAGWATNPKLAHDLRASRTIDAARVISILAAVGIDVDLSIAKGKLEPGSTRLLRKLRAGHLGPTVISGAPSLRADWYALESAFRDDMPSQFVDEIGRARQEVLAIVMGVESRLAPGDDGRAMHVQLSRALAGGVGAQLPLGIAELMGCVYQLTDECTVWWSDQFDATGEAPWLTM